MAKSLSKIQTGFTKIITDLDVLIDANTKKIQTATTKIDSLKEQNSVLDDEKRKAQSFKTNLEKLLGAA